jgi:hypothetical protein
MSHSIDQKTARAADSLAAIVLESYGRFTPGLEIFIEQVEHLEEGHVWRHALHLIDGKCAGRLGALLPPDLECEIHVYL